MINEFYRRYVTYAPLVIPTLHQPKMYSLINNISIEFTQYLNSYLRVLAKKSVRAILIGFFFARSIYKIMFGQINNDIHDTIDFLVQA
jgi:hypothetical protein